MKIQEILAESNSITLVLAGACGVSFVAASVGLATGQMGIETFGAITTAVGTGVGLLVKELYVGLNAVRRRIDYIENDLLPRTCDGVFCQEQGRRPLPAFDVDEANA